MLNTNYYTHAERHDKSWAWHKKTKPGTQFYIKTGTTVVVNRIGQLSGHIKSIVSDIDD